MNQVIEIKYINIAWLNQDSFSKIQESVNSLKIETIEENLYEVEAITYTRLDNDLPGQIAFRFPDDESVEPYFINSQGINEKLIKISDQETAKSWWIENGTWIKSRKYKESQIFRHVGETVLYVKNDFRINIKIRAISFTHEELNLYLNDFRDGLWDLILKNDSYVMGDAKNKQVKLASQSLLDYLKVFVSFSEKTSINLKKELREIQELKPIKSVKAVPRTFMEIVSKGINKELTSRAYKESYNVSENRYIHYILNNVYILVNNLIKSTNRLIINSEQSIRNNLKSLENFSNIIVVDKEIYNLEILDLKKNIQDIKKKILNILETDQQVHFNEDSTRRIFYTEFEFVVTSKIEEDRYDKTKLSMFVKSNLAHEYREKFTIDSRYSGIFFRNSSYKIAGFVRFEISQNEQWLVCDLLNFKDIQILGMPLIEKMEKMEKEKVYYESCQWERKLKSDELTQQNYEKTSIIKKNEISLIQIESSSSIVNQLEPLAKKIKKMLYIFHKQNISISSYFPGSMTFIQNPNYQGAHKVFKEIINSSGINQTLFDLLLETEKIGLVDIPSLYEKWCLIQIIKVLMDKFHFKTVDNWKSDLINTIIKNGRNVSTNFMNYDLNIKVVLTYECVLPNNKRPDYVLDFFSLDNDTKIIKRLIMDAKFYENINDQGGISKVINQLYNEKNYSESGKNDVFILHPSLNAVLHRRTPQEWSHNSFYGENRLFTWAEGKYPNHRYGALLLSPVNMTSSYLDDLQRLIGMILDKLSESIKSDKHVCIVCGGSNCQKNTQQTQAGYEKYQYRCNDCYHVFINNYCFSCKSRLWKHGSYWTYHSTFATEPYNIKCPQCGSVL